MVRSTLSHFQVELHPLLFQKELLDYCRAKGIVVQAYASLASGSKLLLQNPLVWAVGTAGGRCTRLHLLCTPL